MSSEESTMFQWGRAIAAFGEAMSSVARQVAAGMEHLRKLDRELRERTRLAEAEYLASERGQLDRLAASCPGSVAGLIEYSDLVATFYAMRAHRELDELLERLGGGER